MINDAHIAELLIREEGSAIQIRNFAQRKIVQRLKQEIMARFGISRPLVASAIPDTSFRVTPDGARHCLRLRFAPSKLMKPFSSCKAPYKSVPVQAQDLGTAQSNRSFFSLLLDIETRLRAEARRDSLLQAHQRRPAKYESFERQGIRNLSRYIE